MNGPNGSLTQKRKSKVIPHGFDTWLHQRRRGNQSTAKFEVEGPWNVGDPVHESITNAALQNAGIVPRGTRFNDLIVWEYIRGIFWNDDPEGFFFDNNAAETDNWSSGTTFLSHFISHKNEASGGKEFGPGDPLLARSHFGDLQCLHAMAAGDGELATTTRDDIFRWLEFFYGVAAGMVVEIAPLGSITVGRVQEWFPRSSLPVRTLFLIGQKGNARHRAIGAFLHIIQDSYAEGHVERDPSDSILEFHSYIHQNSSKHAHDDRISPGGLSAMPGAQRAIQRCSTILQLWMQNARWEDVRNYLEKEVFLLASDARSASPGESYRV